MFSIYDPCGAEPEPPVVAVDFGVTFSSVQDVNVAIEAMISTRM